MLSTLLATPFGIPFSPATAILLGALVVHGLQPATGGLLGLRRQHVHRQPHAADPEPAPGRRLRDRAAPAAARPRDPRATALSRRGLQPEQQGPLPDGGRAGAGPDDGEDAAPGALPHPRQRRRPGGAPAVGDDPDPRRRRALRPAARPASARETGHPTATSLAPA